MKANGFRFFVFALCCTTACVVLPVRATRAADAAQAANNAGDNQSGPGLEEIIVTAQRRQERLQDVPISVTVLTAENLNAAAVTTTADLGMVTPGLRIDATGTTVQPTIRGITTTLAQGSSESAIAIYEDGVYQPSMANGTLELPDVQQIEVLEGPQGTLFGRNATGGAILIQTLQPNLTDAAAQASVSYGSYNEVLTKVYASTPIAGGKAAVSVTGLIDYDSGWKTDLLNNNQWSGYREDLVRAKLRFEPWEGADFTLTAMWDQVGDYTSLAFSNYDGINGDRAVPGLAPFVASKPWQYSSYEPQFATKRQGQASLHGDIDLGPGKLSTTTAYIHTDENESFDPTNGPLPLFSAGEFSKIHSFEQELVYTTNQLGAFHGTGGLFYFSQRAPQGLDVDNYQIPSTWYTDNTDAYAAFGDLTYDVTDRFSLTGGVRYNHEKATSYTGLAVVGAVPPSLSLLGERTWVSSTPRGSLLYKLTDHTNVYFTYSQGFKSGAFNSSSAQPTPVDPEKVDAYEVGIKTDEIRGLSLNAAGFYYHYDNLQLAKFSVVNDEIQQILTNAADSKIYGAELNVVWRANDNFTLNLGDTYLHARYVSFADAVANVPNPGGAGSSTMNINDSGTPMIRSPDFSGNLTGTYVENTSSGTFDLSGTVFYSTKLYFDVGHYVVQPSYSVVNATLGWKPSPDSKFRISVWGKNLTDKAYITATVITTGFDAVDYGRPRTVGVEFQAKY
jgi:iron complex outermembrane receptor protein